MVPGRENNLPGIFVLRIGIFNIYRKENSKKSFLSGVKSGIINRFGMLDFSRGSGISETA